ncbi:hypothetical protein PG994_011810 [Apiospora phragmitis]|uniref:Uncharacterized protein n=1 Tax=Apiospora phragmitis TaxID=2905665 RepID=A0ABR1TTU0_9PEZI
MAEAEKPLGWLDLPGEVRNKIYLEVLSTPDDTEGWSRPVHTSGENSSEQNGGYSISILRTNKRIYDEARSILYRENTLYLGHPLDLTENILPTVGAKNVSFTRRASLPFPEWEEYPPYPGSHDGTFGMVSVLVQHCPHIEEIEFGDVGLRGSNYQSGGIEQVLEAFLRLSSYLQSIPSLKKITVWVNPYESWRRQFDAFLDDELRVENAMSKAGWVLEGREHYRWA